jgi:signal transduction histidine kinase
VALALFVAVAMLLAVREAGIYVLRDPIGTVHLGLQLLAPLWLGVAAAVLVQDFVQAARAAALERAAMDLRLADLAAVAERQRIMQDIHDGLGSQLVSSLSMAERGQLGPAQTAELLRSCIDDLRLAIDTLAEADVNLAVTAGDLRFRMEPRMRAAGLKLRWDTAGLPDDLLLPGTRVLQESLSNAVKHAAASTVQVRLAVDAGALVLEVADDGCGLPATRSTRGKGLAGMAKRARVLGARLDLGPAGPAGGTCVRLMVPLGAAAA